MFLFLTLLSWLAETEVNNKHRNRQNKYKLDILLNLSVLRNYFTFTFYTNKP